jgi:hypothetical protein
MVFKPKGGGSKRAVKTLSSYTRLIIYCVSSLLVVAAKSAIDKWNLISN